MRSLLMYMHSRLGLNQHDSKRTIHPATGLAFLALSLINIRLVDVHTTYVALLGFTIICATVYQLLRFERGAAMRDMASFAMQDTIDHVHLMIQHILHAYFEQHQLEYQLERTQESLARFHAEQEQLITATQSEVNEQYKHILAYAHYLEQRISSRTADTSLRDDYDDVCEHAFNLQLIVQAMGMLPRAAAAPGLSSIALSERMSSILLDLTPNLERRAMKLTSAEWDDSLHVLSNSEWLTHLLWMVLLGCVRFAEQESTLGLRCVRDGMQAKLDVTVSLLSPGSLSEHERYAYLEKRLTETDEPAHMFASTLDAHANIRLATLLASRLMATLEVIAVSSHQCTVRVMLPCAQQENTLLSE